MGVVECRPLWQTEVSLDRKGKASASQKWLVKVSDPENDGPLTAIDAAGLPVIGDGWAWGTETSTGLWCTSIKARMHSDTTDEYEVDVEFSNDYDEDKDNPNPYDRPPVITCTSEQVSVVVDKDTQGNPVVNKAGEPFSPRPEIERSNWSVNYKFNSPTFDVAYFDQYVDRVNSGTCLGFAAGYLKLANVSASPQNENGVNFFEVTLQFAWKREGWKKKLLNAGRRQKFAGQIVPIVYPNTNEKVTEDWPLDNNGQAAADPSAPGSWQTLEFQVLPTTNLASLLA